MNRYLYSLHRWVTISKGETEVFADIKQDFLYGLIRNGDAQLRALSMLHDRMLAAGANFMEWEQQKRASPYETRIYWKAKFYSREIL